MRHQVEWYELRRSHAYDTDETVSTARDEHVAIVIEDNSVDLHPHWIYDDLVLS
jgi:hypothetical protein